MKRIYLSKAAYLLTTNPINRIPYFEEEVFIEVLAYTIEECLQLKSSVLIGYKLNPEHVHVIIQVGDIYNISQVMHSIKRISSDRINQILAFAQKDNAYRGMKWTTKLRSLCDEFTLKYDVKHPHEYPIFRWQKGFDDQLIRSSSQLSASLNYLRIQYVRHGLNGDRGLKIADSLPRDLRFIER